jgi:hypothetical protein
MTVKRDLKRRVRARQARTGEKYTAALQRVLAEKPEPAFPVVEMVDLSPLAAELGLHGRVLMFPHLADRVDPRAALERMRAALLATREDPSTELFRTLLLEGKPLEPTPMDLWDRREAVVQLALFYGETLQSPRGMAVEMLSEGARFLTRARAGLGGVSKTGRLLAVPVPVRGGLENVVALLWGAWPFPVPNPWPPTVVLGSAEVMLEGTGELEAMVKNPSGDR